MTMLGVLPGDSYPYNYTQTSAPSILLSIMTIILDIFVIKLYWKTELTVVPLLYTFIASLDILTAIGIIHLYGILVLYNGGTWYTDPWNGDKTLDVNVMISTFFLQISYRCSVFCNLVLAVSRTIMILNPFYQINIKKLKLACILYAVPWIVLYGLNVYQFHADYTYEITEHGYLIGLGLAFTCTSYNSRTVFWEPESPTYGILTRDAFYLLAISPDLVAFLIPVIIVIVTCIIQVRTLYSSSQFPTSSNQRHVTITVLLMSTVFVLCNSPLVGYMSVYTISILSPNCCEDDNLFGTKFGFITALSATVLPILNAALNPVIIITRSSGMRREFLDSLQRMLSWVRDRQMSYWDFMVGAYREPRALILRALIRLRALIQRAVIRIRALRARVDRIIGIGLVGLDLLD